MFFLGNENTCKRVTIFNENKNNKLFIEWIRMHPYLICRLVSFRSAGYLSKAFVADAVVEEKGEGEDEVRSKK